MKTGTILGIFIFLATLFCAVGCDFFVTAKADMPKEKDWLNKEVNYKCISPKVFAKKCHIADNDVFLAKRFGNEYYYCLKMDLYKQACTKGKSFHNLKSSTPSYYKKLKSSTPSKYKNVEQSTPSSKVEKQTAVCKCSSKCTCDCSKSKELQKCKWDYAMQGKTVYGLKQTLSGLQAKLKKLKSENSACSSERIVLQKKNKELKKYEQMLKSIGAFLKSLQNVK